MKLRILGFAFLAATVCQTGNISAAAAGQATIQNLQTAFNAESNAQARYLAFAEKADAEGYGPVASLYRAAARSAQIQLSQLESSIRALGDMPKATIQQIPVRSTRENLPASASGNEPYERDIRYGTFIKTAQAERVFAAVSIFEYAEKAHVQRARLFKDASHRLAQMRGNGRAYYVCSTSGFTVPILDPMYCMSGQYETVK